MLAKRIESSWYEARLRLSISVFCGSLRALHAMRLDGEPRYWMMTPAEQVAILFTPGAAKPGDRNAFRVEIPATRAGSVDNSHAGCCAVSTDSCTSARPIGSSTWNRASLMSIVSNACGCAEDLVEPIRADLCYPVGDIIALERAMMAAITDAPPPAALESAHFQVRC